MCMCVCVCVICMYVKEREREREREMIKKKKLHSPGCCLLKLRKGVGGGLGGLEGARIVRIR